MTQKLETEKEEFVRFLVLTREEREIAGLPKTQRDWAKLNGIHESTLSGWKLEPEIQERTKRLREAAIRAKLPKVDAALYRKAVKTGNYYEAKLLYQRFDDFSEKSEQKVDIGEQTLAMWLRGNEPTAVHPEDTTESNLVS